jgi:cell division protein FtsB
VKEIKDDLGRLNAQISQLSKSMSALVGEKTRLETRVDFLNKQYVKKNNQCVVS